MNEWTVENWRGTAADFHDFVPPPRRSLWVVDLVAPALVLGSSQSPGSVDADLAGALDIPLARRHSGGGAVWLHPGQSVWMDITIPRNDPLWVDDVSSSMGWVGHLFCAALGDVQPAVVSETPYVATPLARVVCFGGLAPGEVVTGGAKTIGVSQRRTREGARFQCVAYTEWNTEPWVGVLSDAGIRDATRALSVAEIAVSADDLIRRVISSLPR